MGGITSAGSWLLILTMTGLGAPPRLSKHVGLLTCSQWHPPRHTLILEHCMYSMMQRSMRSMLYHQRTMVLSTPRLGQHSASMHSQP